MKARTVEILKSFASISNQILFRVGTEVRIASAQNHKFGIATLDDEDAFPTEFAIYDLTEFLSVYGLFEAPVIEYREHECVISDGDSRKMVHYKYANKAIINAPSVKPISLGDTRVTFNMSKKVFENATKAAAIMRLNEMRVNENGVTLLNVERGSDDASGNSYDVDVGDFTVVDLSEKPNLYIAFGDLKMIPDDYVVTFTTKGVVFDSVQGDLKYVLSYITH